MFKNSPCALEITPGQPWSSTATPAPSADLHQPDQTTRCFTPLTGGRGAIRITPGGSAPPGSRSASTTTATASRQPTCGASSTPSSPPASARAAAASACTSWHNPATGLLGGRITDRAPGRGHRFVLTCPDTAPQAPRNRTTSLWPATRLTFRAVGPIIWNTPSRGAPASQSGVTMAIAIVDDTPST